MQLVRKYAGAFFISLNAGILLFALSIFNMFYRKFSKVDLSNYADLLHYLKRNNTMLMICLFIIPFIGGLLLISNNRLKLYASVLSLLALLFYTCIAF